MKCHELDFEIFGNDMQTVEVELDPGQTVVAEAGAMAIAKLHVKTRHTRKQ